MTFVKGHDNHVYPVNSCFTQIFEWHTKILCLLQFFAEVAQNSLSFSCSEKSLSIPGFPGLWPPCTTVTVTTKQAKFLSSYSRFSHRKSYTNWPQPQRANPRNFTNLPTGQGSQHSTIQRAQHRAQLYGWLAESWDDEDSATDDPREQWPCRTRDDIQLPSVYSAKQNKALSARCMLMQYHVKRKFIYKAGLRHVRGVRPNRAVDFRGGRHFGPPFWTRFDLSWIGFHFATHCSADQRTRNAATRCVLRVYNAGKCDCGRGSAPDPTGGVTALLQTPSRF